MHNGNSGNLSTWSGCYVPGPGLRLVSAQDALIVLGSLANTPAFFNVKTYRNLAVLAEFNTAVIVLVKVGHGEDAFTTFDIASQAIEVIKYCIIQQPPASRLGGAIEVGSKNVFRLLVQTRTLPEGTSETS